MDCSGEGEQGKETKVKREGYNLGAEEVEEEEVISRKEPTSLHSRKR